VSFHEESVVQCLQQKVLGICILSIAVVVVVVVIITIIIIINCNCVSTGGSVQYTSTKNTNTI
jgi:hypothetical protein